MKIGILTYHCVPNFGAQLQTISTVGYLKRLGHEPIVLHWFPDDLENIYAKGRVPQKQIQVHNELTRCLLPLSRLCRSEMELVAEVDNLHLDAIIVGSDALFKYQPEKSRRAFSKRRLHYVVYPCVLVESLDGNPFFGAFLLKLKNKLPAVAFSVSSQNCPYMQMGFFERRRMKLALTNYDYISVRDEWTKRMVMRITHCADVPITPDPVFSFNQNRYFQLPDIEMLKVKYNLRDKYILVSFSNNYIDKDYIVRLERAIENTGFQPIAFPMPEGCFSFGMHKTIDIPLNPLDWYVLIQHASGYIGERMHPIVVSIHNAVPFYCFDEYGVMEPKTYSKDVTYKKESSKTYSILQKAEFLDYIFAYKGDESIPTPEEVMKKILSFDTAKCKVFAENYQKYYETSMNAVLNLLKKI